MFVYVSEYKMKECFLSIFFIGANIVRALHVVCARSDIVATELGIIGANVVRAHERFPCGGRRSGH